MKDYISEAIISLIDKKISKVSQEAKYVLKNKLLEDLLISDSDTFSSVTLDIDNNLQFLPVDPNSIVVYRQGSSTFYQRYTDWISNGPAGTIKFLSTGSISSGDNIVVDYKYYLANPGAYLTQVKDQFTFTVPGVISTGTNITLELFSAGELTIEEVFISVKAAPSGSSIIVDVNKNGATIFTTQSNRPEIASGNTSGTSGTPDTAALAKNDKLTIDIDQVGSTIPGEDLTVLIRVIQEA